MRIGQGFDIHRLVEGRKLILGGVEIPNNTGLLGHSDGDALLHAITDAILGAAGLGDIGLHFPPEEQAYEGANSLNLLRKSAELLRAKGFRILNVDSTILCEGPKMSPFYLKMRTNIAEALNVAIECTSVKAKTMEGMGEIGRKEAIAAQAIALIEETENV
ncbi:MAG TPA: 2-C-methyl-D-erythritol 2,4-cyclodiphosphate synthase [Oculatellaceae cyanobacterium]